MKIIEEFNHSILNKESKELFTLNAVIEKLNRDNTSLNIEDTIQFLNNLYDYISKIKNSNKRIETDIFIINHNTIKSQLLNNNVTYKSLYHLINILKTINYVINFNQEIFNEIKEYIINNIKKNIDKFLIDEIDEEKLSDFILLLFELYEDNIDSELLIKLVSKTYNKLSFNTGILSYMNNKDLKLQVMETFLYLNLDLNNDSFDKNTFNLKKQTPELYNKYPLLYKELNKRYLSLYSLQNEDKKHLNRIDNLPKIINNIGNYPNRIEYIMNYILLSLYLSDAKLEIINNTVDKFKNYDYLYRDLILSEFANTEIPKEKIEDLLKEKYKNYKKKNLYNVTKTKDKKYPNLSMKTLMELSIDESERDILKYLITLNLYEDLKIRDRDNLRIKGL